MKPRHKLLFVLILFVALLLRLWLAPMRGHVHDVEQLKGWVETAVTQNPLGIYTYSSANYPPLGLLPLVVMGHVYRGFFSPGFDVDSTVLTALLKLPGITADLVTAVVLFVYLSKRYDRRWGLVGLAAYGLNPGVMYDTAWWGQLESLVTLPMLLSVLAVAEGRIRWGWFWLAVAVLVKPQAVVIGPIILVASWRMGGWRRVMAGMGTAVFTGLVVLLPFIVVGQIPALIGQIRASAGRQLFLTMNAHNFWYLVSLGRGSFAARDGNPIFDTEPLVGSLTGWQVGLGLFGVWGLWVCWRLYLGRQDACAPLVFWGAGAMVVGFFMLPAEAHERYLFPVFVFLVLLLPLGWRYWVLYGLFSITFLLNLMWVDSAVSWPGFEQDLGWGVLLAAVNLGVFVFYGVWLGVKASIERFCCFGL